MSAFSIQSAAKDEFGVSASASIPDTWRLGTCYPCFCDVAAMLSELVSYSLMILSCWIRLEIDYDFDACGDMYLRVNQRHRFVISVMHLDAVDQVRTVQMASKEQCNQHQSPSLKVPPTLHLLLRARKSFRARTNKRQTRHYASSYTPPQA